MPASLQASTSTPRRSATICPCGRYRFRLERRWGEGGTVNFIMLNPSVADAMQDDPTIRRCLVFARAWGLEALVVTNLFAFRAADPEDLWAQPPARRIGRGNDDAVLEAATQASLIVCAWGAGGRIDGRGNAVRNQLDGFRLHAMGLTRSGEPRHPLYLPGTSSERCARLERIG
jgi:hypothetical protein